MRLSPGIQLGHYRIVSLLGAGGMGEVYRADDTVLGRQVAIKTLPADRVDADALARFKTEARALAALSHPNILAIYEFGRLDDIVYAVAELLEGETLRDRMERVGAFAWQKAAAIAASVADGLAAAHAKGIVHRDLKPENLFITSDGRLKILDFGLARMAPERASDDEATAKQTAAGTVMGTLHYMSPEQLRGDKVDQTTDLFSLGCVLYEMVAKRQPFARASAAETISAIMADAAPDMSSLSATSPPELVRIIEHCLEKSRQDRFQSARDVAFSLRALLPSAETGAGIPWRLRKRGWLAGAGLVLVLSATGYVFVRRAHKTLEKAAIGSLAVLPFENNSGDQDAEYLSDGLTEGLINSLAKLPNMRVLARTTSFSYKKRPIEPREIGRELKVDAVVTGKLALHGDALIIQAELVDVATLSQLWGERYEQHSRELVSVQETIARQLAQQLRPQLTQPQRRQISAGDTQNPQAYALYLRGRFEMNKRNADAMRRASDFFRRAIEIDPRFALAYSGLADSYYIGRELGSVSATEVLKAGPATSWALELAPQLPEAHASRGLEKLQQWAWDEAETEFKAAISLNPNYSSAHLWYALLLGAAGRYDESTRELHLAEAVDPLSAVVIGNIARSLEREGRFEEAAATARRALDIDPNFAWGHYVLALANIGLGRSKEAIAGFEKVRGTAGFQLPGEAGLAIAYASVGRTDEARKLARGLEEAMSHSGPGAAFVAMAYSALHDDEKTLAWLNKGIEDRDGSMLPWAASVSFRHLRTDPRYQDVLRRLARR